MKYAPERLQFLQALLDERIGYERTAMRYNAEFKAAITFGAIVGLVFRGTLHSSGRMIHTKRDVLAKSRREQVYKLHLESWSAEVIARKVGVSENRVHKIIAMECEARGKRRVRKARQNSPQPPLVFTAGFVPHAPSYGPPVTFDQLDKIPLGLEEQCMCRHYVGNPTDSLFCGRPSVPGRAYCIEHCMLAYRAPNAPPRTQDHEIKIKKQAKEFMAWRRRQVIEMRKAA